MIRKIIEVNEEKCNGCGLCAEACHEDAIGMVDGKARLLREDYCDGLGDCLPACPTGAITFVEREAAAYDAEAVKAAQEAQSLPCGCPGTHSRAIEREGVHVPVSQTETQSELRQWPVQIKLVPVNAPYFENANLLVTADCAAYARAGFHGEFMRNKITLIGCPKLDDVDYSEKLTAILQSNNIKSVTVVRMEVPCCSGIVSAVKTALAASGKLIPWQVVTLTTDGGLLEG